MCTQTRGRLNGGRVSPILAHSSKQHKAHRRIDALFCLRLVFPEDGVIFKGEDLPHLGDAWNFSPSGRKQIFSAQSTSQPNSCACVHLLTCTMRVCVSACVRACVPACARVPALLHTSAQCDCVRVSVHLCCVCLCLCACVYVRVNLRFPFRLWERSTLTHKLDLPLRD